MLRSKQITTKKEKFISALKVSFGVIYVACEYAGISRQTYHNYVKNDKKFAERVNTIKEEFLDEAESQLVKLISSGNNSATGFFLETKGKKRGYYRGQKPMDLGIKIQFDNNKSGNNFFISPISDEEERTNC